ncbi:hypothetical protein HHL16_17820 [Pseudoflavitalea sp. G-6-1-2]|uniref:hypothetical protein n=1 Tax=Pseudoflavitalea sp. G-6-1-2 TaxID=2728841 RepID=UPI00146CE21C|nr:hypothetical protein [Pseudoflavitalea sp. G-6-1-2]NML22747.1 hypothetical protein [Pseudoflavitalea sp. G-6-1-2]
MTLYRIATYILLAVAALIALPIVVLLPAALANPLMFVSIIIGAALVIYSYTSYRFLKMGVQEYFYCKPSLRTLIKVSSYISVGIAALSVVEAGIMIASPEKLQLQAEEYIKQLPPSAADQGQIISNFMMATPWIMLAYYLIIIPHVFYTWKLLKQYGRVFDPPPARSENDEQ